MLSRNEEYAATACLGKQLFKTFNLAAGVANRRGQKGREKMRVYRCEVCRGWHLGHGRAR